MDNEKNNQLKVVVSAEVYPYEKAAFRKWWQGRFHSEADAIRSYIRQVTNFDPSTAQSARAG